MNDDDLIPNEWFIIDGWLVIFCFIAVVFAPLLWLVSAGLVVAAAIAGRTEGGVLATAIISTAVQGCIVAWGVRVGVMISYAHQDAARAARLYLACQFGLSVAILAVGAGVGAADLVSASLVSGIPSGIWLLYFTVSRRVRATFPPLVLRQPPAF